MKRKLTEAFLVCILLLALSGIGQTQVIAPISATDSQVPMEILMGLIGNYMIDAQQYQSMVAQGETPDSVIEFRLAAKISVGGDATAELDPILTGISEMAFWIEANVFARYPYLLKVDLSGSLGNMELANTPAGVVIVSRDEAVYSLLPLTTDVAESVGNIDIPIDVPLPVDLSTIDLESLLSLEALQTQIATLLIQYLDAIGMSYDGLELTPKGMAHVVRLGLFDTGMIVSLWVLDETWDLYKVEIEDMQGGGSAIMVIESIELVAPTLADSTFVVDTSALAGIQYDDLVALLGIKVLTTALAGEPIAADLSVSLPEVRQGDWVVLNSNGMDAADKESDLTAVFEYRSPDGLWTPIENAVYIGGDPIGYWQVAFTPPLSELPGSYDFKITYVDTIGFSSVPLELTDVLNVVAVPSQIVEVSPSSGQTDVSLSSQISISFDQGMDKASAESAFSLVDSTGQAVAGSFEWADNSLIFKPAEGLSYGQVYIAKTLGSAAGLNGVTVDSNMDGISEGSPGDDLVWNFTAEYAPLPGIVELTPADTQTEVPVCAQVSVTFSEGMNQALVESVFSFNTVDGCAFEGDFQWTDNILTFIPSQELAYNTTYQLRIAGNAESALGMRLDFDGDGVAESSPQDDVSWWFSTETAPVFAVKPTAQTGLAGDFISVDIYAQAVSQLHDFTFTLDFDPTVLTIVKIERASFAVWRPRPKLVIDADVWQSTLIDDEQGSVTIAADSTRAGGISGSGKIATVMFQSVGVGESMLNLIEVAAADVAGDIIPLQVSNASAEILAMDPSDINGDGLVDIKDFIIMQDGRGANADVNGDGVVNILDMVIATGGSQGSPVFVPSVSSLEPNFPNPFNPETWIPYQLASESDVFIRVYSAAGRLVRTIDLGYRSAGRYMTKSNAAYWDGANECGEHVASGIYYYSISAGEFSAVRKMVITE